MTHRHAGRSVESEFHRKPQCSYSFMSSTAHMWPMCARRDPVGDEKSAHVEVLKHGMESNSAMHMLLISTTTNTSALKN
jgi:hypothetical protein